MNPTAWPLTTPVAEGLDVVFDVNEGARAHVGEVIIVGASVLSRDELEDRMKLRRDSSFVEEAFHSDMEFILQSYENAGYPYASIEVADFRLSESGERIDYVIAVEEGPVVRIGSVTADSAGSFSRLLENAGGIRRGELYNQEKLEKLIRLHQQLHLKYSVDYLIIGKRMSKYLFLFIRQSWPFHSLF